MAEQDFTINIRTTADTAGIERVKAALTSVGAQVQSINAAGGGGGGDGGGEGGAGLLDKAATKIEHGIFRSAVHAIGIGVVYEIVGALREAAKEIEKISDDLDKQGEQLVKNTQLYGEQAKHATDAVDVIKISDNALKQIETTQKKVNDLVKEGAGYWEQFSNFVQKTDQYLAGRDPNKIKADYEQARQANLDTADSQARQAQREAIKQVDEAQSAQDRSLEEIIEDTKKAIEVEQERANQAKKNDDAKAYVEAVNALNRYNLELEKSLKLQDQKFDQQRREDEATAAEHEKDVDFVQEQVKRASPQARAALMNEQAAQLARDQGKDRQADLLQQSADRFKQFATPQQKEEIGVLEKLIEQTGILREIRDSWK